MAAPARPETFTEGFHDEATLTNMRYRPLNGKQVSILSFGASSLGGVFHTTDDKESVKVVDAAIRGGINLIDSAPWYGHGRSETVLGAYFRSVRPPRPAPPRPPASPAGRGPREAPASPPPSRAPRPRRRRARPTT